MSPDELKALGEDINKNGLASPIALWRADPKSPLYLLDGRNRLDAIEMATGKPVEVGAPSIMAGEFLAADKVVVLDGRSVDPWAYAVSANIHRRHLTPEKKREVIAELLKATPEKSNRQIAETVKASHVTVGAVRAEMEATGQIDQLTETVGKDGKARKQPTPKPGNRAADQDVSPQPTAPKRETAKKDVNRSHEHEQRRFEATLTCIRESCESTVDMALPRVLTREGAAAAINSLSKSAEQIGELLQRLRSQRRLLEPNPDDGLDIPASLQRTRRSAPPAAPEISS